MELNRKTLMSGLVLAMVMSLGLPMQAEANNRKFKNAVGGAAIGAGVGAIVGGKKSVATGAIVGAIAGATK